MSLLDTVKSRARQLKQHTLTVYFAARDPRTPLAVRMLALLVAAYALSPIDLIPDFIPVLGLLDDLIIVPLGLALIVRLTPPEILEAARQRALETTARPTSYAAAALMVSIWLMALAAAALWLYRLAG